MQFCKEYDKYINQGHCPFDVVCKEECVFTLKKQVEDINELKSENLDLEMQLDNSVSEAAIQELKSENDDLQATVNNQDEDIEKYQNVLFALPNMIKHKDSDSLRAMLYDICSLNAEDCEDIIKKFFGDNK